MIKRIININNYWKVIVYYNIDYNFFDYVENDLLYYGTPVESIKRIYHNMRTNAKAFTYSNFKYRVSIVRFNKHFDKYDVRRYSISIAIGCLIRYITLAILII